MLVVWPEATQSWSLQALWRGYCRPPKRTCANTCLPGLPLPMPLSLQQNTANPHLCRRPSDTHQQVWLSLLWDHCSILLGPDAHRFLLCPPRVCFLWGSQSLCQIPRLGNLLWAPELSQQCKNFFGIIVLQFVGHLLGGSMAGLMETYSKRT